MTESLDHPKNRAPRRSIPVKIANTPNTRSGRLRKIPQTLRRTHAAKWFLRLPRRIQLIISALSLAIMSAALYLLIIQPVVTVSREAIDEGVSAIKNDPSSTQPQYKTLTPHAASIEQYGGWTRVSPLDKNPVFAYADTVDSIRITVSQQPLPEDFKDDTAVQMEQLAQGYKANEKITVGESIVYIGTSAKGPQSVIVNRGDLLILIKSNAKISSDRWAEYINSLE